MLRTGDWNQKLTPCYLIHTSPEVKTDSCDAEGSRPASGNDLFHGAINLQNASPTEMGETNEDKSKIPSSLYT